MNNVKTSGLGLALTAVAVAVVVTPAIAQNIGATLGDPVAMIQSAVRSALLAVGAIASGAGIYKGIQVWSGQRQWSEAATGWFAGAALAFGVAAAVGFS